jgi:hypothetical protein
MSAVRRVSQEADRHSEAGHVSWMNMLESG